MKMLQKLLPVSFWLAWFCAVTILSNNINLINTNSLQPLSKNRRDVFSLCSDNLLADRVTHTKAALTGDSNFNLAVTWVGTDSSTLLLLTTLEMTLFIRIKAPSKLYISNDYGKTFKLASHEALKNADIRKDFGMMKSPLNPKKLILVSYTFHSLFVMSRFSSLYITEDGAKSWEKVLLKFEVREREPLQTHPKQENWLITQSTGRRSSAWVSTNFGKTWFKMKLNSQIVKWGAYDDKEQETIFVTTSAGSLSTESTLWRSRDLGKTFTKLVEHVYSFGVQGGFVFVSVQLQDSKNRIMHVSTNGGDKFEEADVPAIKSGQFYSIVEMVTGMIFLHADEEGNTGKGTLYTSNADGIVYAESLRDHFYTNLGVTNFYRVQSMRGVYITHRLNTDKTMSSLITFDNGGHWQTLYLSDQQCKEEKVAVASTCSLHHHGAFSQSRGVQVQPPLSHTNVYGLILLHGGASDALTNKTNVYLSRNGGYNWTKILDGPHHYAIADHGNIIVVVSRMNQTASELHFSLNFGICWHKVTFSDTPIVVRGVVTEPGAKTRRFSIWGFDYSKSGASREWVVVTLDFHNVFERACHQGDYTFWTPHGEGNKGGCLLGIKEKYPRRITEQNCFSGEDYVPEITKTKCPCSMEDLECDYGYFYDNGKCKRKEHIQEVLCINNEVDKISDWHGFRRIPGDECVGETHTTKYLDAHERCHLSGDATYGIVTKTHIKHKHKVALVLFLFAIIIAIIGLSIYLLRQRLQNRGPRPSYKYSELVSQENDSYVAVDGRNGNTLTYHDDSESDAEMLNL